ncbi:MAG: peroxiredoxin [Melioribacteraceae bacterium]|nr:MAG: peroxiredoxin [Melioribacteraceae bacterium]
MYRFGVLFLLTVLLVACGGNADNITVNQEAPDFTLQDIDGNNYKLSDYEGENPVVIYFYPKASTPGCTKQACGIRDDFAKFDEKGIKVFGVSVDDKEDLAEFREEYTLNFPLLSDADKKVAEEYGVLNNIGLASRITFIIDKSGKIAEIIRDVDVDTHSDDVYKIASKLL